MCYCILNQLYYIVVDQLNQILYVLGTPDDDTLNRIGSERVNIKCFYGLVSIWIFIFIIIWMQLGSDLY